MRLDTLAKADSTYGARPYLAQLHVSHYFCMTPWLCQHPLKQTPLMISLEQTFQSIDFIL